AFEDVAGVVEPILLHARQVGMTGTRLGERLLGTTGSGRHLLLPFRPLSVADLDSHRRAERASVAHAAQDRHVVALEPHARPPPEPETPPGELLLDLLHGDRQPGGQPFDHDYQRATMRLASSEEPEHEP